MIDKTIGWSLKNRLFVVLGGLLLLVWGPRPTAWPRKRWKPL